MKWSPGGESQDIEDRRDESGDCEIDLLIPEDDVVDPEVSIVVPAVDEELTITEFVSYLMDHDSTRGLALELAGIYRCRVLQSERAVESELVPA